MGVIAEDAAPVLQKELAGYSALLMGPGWGREESTGLFLAAMLNDRAQQEARHRRIGFAPGSAKPAPAAVADFPLPPLVIDADGLNRLGELDEWWKLLPAGTILTPHPGEMGRLTGLSRDEVQARRLELAAEKAIEWRCVVVLKGAFTVIRRARRPDGRAAVRGAAWRRGHGRRLGRHNRRSPGARHAALRRGGRGRLSARSGGPLRRRGAQHATQRDRP
jgi:NAD(P)H-hydrate repair Nnr-like enzyme with NAD(P)H-hydrate dehydratase domain